MVLRRCFVVVALCGTFAISSCADLQQYGYGQQGAGMGAVGGAVIGQAIGRSTEATLIGAAVGLLLGYIVGNEMDKYDRQNVAYAMDTVPSGRTYEWQNPDSGNMYAVTPTPAYTQTQGREEQICREAQITAYIAGEGNRTTKTVACLNPVTQQWELQ